MTNKHHFSHYLIPVGGGKGETEIIVAPRTTHQAAQNHRRLLRQAILLAQHCGADKILEAPNNRVVWMRESR